MLGATVTAQTIAQIGIKGIPIRFVTDERNNCRRLLDRKKLRFSDTSSLMMAGGNAVCGSSAIASIEPVIHADEEEKARSSPWSTLLEPRYDVDLTPFRFASLR